MFLHIQHWITSLFNRVQVTITFFCCGESYFQARRDLWYASGCGIKIACNFKVTGTLLCH